MGHQNDTSNPNCKGMLSNLLLREASYHIDFMAFTSRNTKLGGKSSTVFNGWRLDLRSCETNTTLVEAAIPLSEFTEKVVFERVHHPCRSEFWISSRERGILQVLPKKRTFCRRGGKGKGISGKFSGNCFSQHDLGCLATVNRRSLAGKRSQFAPLPWSARVLQFTRLD